MTGPLSASRTPTRRAASVRELISPTLRSMPWPQLTASGGLAVLLMLGTVGSGELPIDLVVVRLRLAAVLLAVGAAGALDDPTRPHLDGAPVPLAVRQALRLVLVLTVTAIWWGLTLVSAAYHPAILSSGHRGGSLPIPELSTFLAALVLASVAVAALVTRSRGGAGAIPAAATAVLIPVLAVVVPRLLAAWTSLDLTMFPSGVDAISIAAHQRWMTLAAISALVVVWAIPGSRIPRRRVRGARRAQPEPDSIPPTSVRPIEGVTPR